MFNATCVTMERPRDDNRIMEADPKEQARLLCVMLTTNFPESVSRAFAELTGADYDTILSTGFRVAKMLPKPRKAYKIGTLNHFAKLTEEQVREVINDKENRPSTYFASKFNVSSGAIGDIRNGITWKHISKEE